MKRAIADDSSSSGGDEGTYSKMLKLYGVEDASSSSSSSSYESDSSMADNAIVQDDLDEYEIIGNDREPIFFFLFFLFSSHTIVRVLWC